MGGSLMSNFMDNLIGDIVGCEDTFDVCRVLLNSAYGENYKLSDEQFNILANIFSDSEIAAATVMFLHSFEEFNEDFEKLQTLYEAVHEKFAKNKILSNGKSKIIA
jgi:hypothetical protein